MAPTKKKKKKKVRYARLTAQLPNSMAECGTTAVWLPGDAIFDILSWVPVKSLCRFRCVCKDWLSLISDPAFVVNHKHRAASEQFLVGSYCEVNRPAYNSGMLVMDLEGNLLWTINVTFPVVCSTLDNLVCFSGFDAVTRVVDVTTGKVLVTCPTEPDEPFAISISLGRAAASNSTKVFRITENTLYQQTCDVLTLGSVHDDNLVWRQAPLPPTAVRVFYNESSSATVSGVVHFLASTFAVPHRPAASVLCFDLETEEWSKTIQGPLNEDMDLWSKTKQVRLTGLNETLCMIQTEEYETKNLRANLWLLVDADKSIWAMTHAIQMARPFYIVQPLAVMPDGVKLLLHYRSSSSLAPVLRVYDPSVGTCTDALKLPQNTFHNISVCNLHLDRFVTPARSN